MKEQKQPANWYMAATHYLTAGFAMPTLAAFFVIIPLSLFIGKNSPLLVGVISIFVGYTSIWLGVIYSSKYILKKYPINEPEKLINLATIYQIFGWTIDLLIKAGKSSFSAKALSITAISAAVSTLIFYFCSKQYLHSNAHVYAESKIPNWQKLVNIGILLLLAGLALFFIIGSFEAAHIGRNPKNPQIKQKASLLIHENKEWIRDLEKEKQENLLSADSLVIKKLQSDIESIKKPGFSIETYFKEGKLYLRGSFDQKISKIDDFWDYFKKIKNLKNVKHAYTSFIKVDEGSTKFEAEITIGQKISREDQFKIDTEVSKITNFLNTLKQVTTEAGLRIYSVEPGASDDKGAIHLFDFRVSQPKSKENRQAYIDKLKTLTGCSIEDSDDEVQGIKVLKLKLYCSS